MKGTREDELSKAFRAKFKPVVKAVHRGAFQEAEKRTLLDPVATPAPRLEQEIEKHGSELTEAAMRAWERRVDGEPIIRIAHDVGLTIEGTKTLIREVHAAIRDDLKDALELNRQLDLERVDGLIRTYYPIARDGTSEICIDAANVTLRALQHRSKLTGLEPIPDPSRSQQPQNVLVWIQNQLPAINRIVEALPPELPPHAP